MTTVPTASPVTTPSSAPATLHVTNGDSAAHCLQASGLSGTIVPWRDVLHDGPVPPDVNRRAFRMVRAEFLASRGWSTAPRVQDAMELRDDAVDAAGSGDEVVLWFEPDLYDQLQLAQVLSRFHAREVSRRPALAIVPADRMLGAIERAEVQALHAARRPLREADLLHGARAWQAVTDADPDALVSMAREPQPAPPMRQYASNPDARAPYLNAALHRLLEEFPARNGGLSRSELQLCETLMPEALTLSDCYIAAHHGQEEWPWLGDSGFAWYVERVSTCAHPLVVRVDGRAVEVPAPGPADRAFWSERIQLTPFGRDVVDGRADHIEANGIDRWIGSMHLRDGQYWRWDARGQRLLTMQDALRSGQRDP